jgi:hypothetical protein
MRRFALTTIVFVLAVAGVAAAAAADLPSGHRHATVGADIAAEPIAGRLAAARLATAKYATNLDRARKDGYGVITRMIPDMGWHFLNAKVTGFDLRRPPILVYGKRGSSWQLVAFEWVFPEKPKTPPLPGAKYGSFAAACHYKDGTFTPAATQEECAASSPQTGAAFGFWHPDLVTLHVWLWYPNPDGLYAGRNPLMRPFNHG